jgi:hypothetical protein
VGRQRPHQTQLIPPAAAAPPATSLQLSARPPVLPPMSATMLPLILTLALLVVFVAVDTSPDR